MVGSASEFVRARYRLAVPVEAAAERAEALRYEQTVELPREAVQDPFVEKEILPRVEALDPVEGGVEATLAYPVATTAHDPAQLLGVLFGNCSLQDDVALVAVSLPDSLAAALGGPRFGASGLRRLTGVAAGPLTCTPLKPMGLGPERLAELAALFARAGIDVIKDDNGLADHAFCPFEARVRAVQEALGSVAQATGRRVLYAPQVTGTPSTVRRQLETARALDVRAVMLSPALLGLPTLQELARGEPELALLAHCSFAGAPRVTPEVLLGSLYRACGADAVIFPHAGGRFARFDVATCRRLAEELTAPRPGRRRALPVPGGGMSEERVEELLRFYGPDTMLLVGGSLRLGGAGLEARARAFVALVRETARRLAPEAR